MWTRTGVFRGKKKEREKANLKWKLLKASKNPGPEGAFQGFWKCKNKKDIALTKKPPMILTVQPDGSTAEAWKLKGLQGARKEFQGASRRKGKKRGQATTPMNKEQIDIRKKKFPGCLLGGGRGVPGNGGGRKKKSPREKGNGEAWLRKGWAEDCKGRWGSGHQ